MTAATAPSASPSAGTDALYPHLDALENESIYILRETFRHFKKSAMLWSIGKDSCVMLWLARKAFFGHMPIPCGPRRHELQDPRDDRVPRPPGARVEAQPGRRSEQGGARRQADVPRRRARPGGLLLRVETRPAGGGHRGEGIPGRDRGHPPRRGRHPAPRRRYFSPRNKDFEWNFRDQPPEFWGQFQTDFEPGTHLRVHPLLHWTELNVWEYIHRENIPLVSLYYARNGRRYRSLGCAPCTGTVESNAATLEEIIDELRQTKIAERSTRAQDQESEDAFERLRASGYM